MSNCCGPLPCAPFLIPEALEALVPELSLQSHEPGEKALRKRISGSQEDAPLVSKLPGLDGDKIFADAGIVVPPMYATPFRRWMCLCVFSFVSAAASGPMSMFPTLEPILVSEKVFEGPNQLPQLTDVYSITLGVLMMSFLPVGIIYDSYGPRWCSVVGSLLFSVFSVGIGLSIQYEDLNWMLYFMYPIALLFGFGKNYGAYGYQWLLPESQNTVNSIIVATQALSDSLVVICVWLHSQFGMQLWTYFYALAVFAVVTGLVCSIIVPSRKQHFAYAEAVVTAMAAAAAAAAGGAAGAGYGSGGNTGASSGASSGGASEGKSKQDILKTTSNRSWVVKQASPRTSGWRWLDNVNGVRTLCRKYPVEHMLFVSGCCFMYMFTWYPTMQMFPYYFRLFGRANATYLVNCFAVIYGMLGAIATIMTGRIVDWIGVQKAVGLNNCMIVVTLTAFLIPTLWSQLIFQTFLTCVLSFFQVFAYRFCMLYGPPEIFGTYTGILLSCMGIFQVSCTAVLSLVLSHVGKYETLFVQGMTAFFGICAISTWTGLVCYWAWRPHPEAGSVTRKDAGVPEESEYIVDGEEKESDPWL